MHRPLLPSVLRALLFAALTVALGAVLRFLLVDDVHAYSRLMLQELYAEAGSIDTLFLGSSHAYRSFDPDMADRLLGVHSFNAGTSQQLPDGSYYLLREAAEENDLQTVYLETFYTVYNQASSRDVPLACFLITDYLRPTSPNRYAYLWEMGGLAALPDLVFPARHAIAEPGEMPALWRAKLSDGYEAGNYRYVTYPDEEYRGCGYVYTHTVSPYPFTAISAVDPAAPLSEFGWENLRRITEYCRGKGIRLVLVTAPLPSAFAADTPHYQAYVDAMRGYAASSDSEYWDFTLYRDAAALALTPAHFSDAHHLNGAGAELFTGVFCQVAARSAAGEDVSALFYSTLDEKLRQAPDGTYPPAANG